MQSGPVLKCKCVVASYYAERPMRSPTDGDAILLVCATFCAPRRRRKHPIMGKPCTSLSTSVRPRKCEKEREGERERRSLLWPLPIKNRSDIENHLRWSSSLLVHGFYVLLVATQILSRPSTMAVAIQLTIDQVRPCSDYSPRLVLVKLLDLDRFSSGVNRTISIKIASWPARKSSTLVDVEIGYGTASELEFQSMFFPRRQ